MSIHSPALSSPHPSEAAAGAPAQPVRMPSFAWRLPAWVVASLVSLVAALGLVQFGPADDGLDRQLAAFQQRVGAEAGPPSSVLARRYRDALQPELRQRITDQVHAEQRSGMTPAGHEAFVLRRLELYEAALLSARTVAAARAP